MNINRQRPPKGCDLGLWLSGVVNDALRDATEAGLTESEAAGIVAQLARHTDGQSRKEHLSTALGRYMKAEPVGTDPEVYIISSSRSDAIGTIEWYPRWRPYVLRPESTAVFSEDCLRVLARFCVECTKELKAETDRRVTGHE